jgi:hypothetical protein
VFIRILVPHLQPGKSNEAAVRWKEVFSPIAKANSQFKQGFMAASEDGAKVVVVTFWDELPDDERSARVEQQVREHLHDLIAGKASMTHYEVLAQV